ncbi:MAG: 4Fe-4S binding protein [Candidatus Lokiarchaeota archaeon]|nr:4Fe-4S binding protein [Candidatus Lokiarchaeota archaeon]
MIEDARDETEATKEIKEMAKKDLEIEPDRFVLNWAFGDVNKKLTYDINKCIGCSLCKLACPVDAIDLGPIPEIIQGIIDDSNPKLLIDHEKCCYCMLCAVVCPNDAFHENITPTDQIVMDQYPTIDKFYEIDTTKCIEDLKNETCKLCLSVRERHHVKDYYLIQEQCPTKCFKIASPIEGKVRIKKSKLHKCDPAGCKACVLICPTRSFFIPESAEDVIKYGKIACNEEACFYCGACENSCPDDLIEVERKSIKILDPKKSGNYPWIQAWIKYIKEILRKRLIYGKVPLKIPQVQKEVEAIKEKIEEEIPQLTNEDRQKLSELNEKVQALLKSSKIRYWIKDKKLDKIRKELKKNLDTNS